MSNDQLDQRLVVAGDRLDQLHPAVEAGAPWPLASQFDHAPEASWGPNELLAHVAEMLPYWLGEVERILAGRTSPLPFGRVGTDPVRVAIIGRDRTLPIGELYTRINGGIARWSERWEHAHARAAREAGQHVTRRHEMTVARPSRFVAGHLEEHLDQLAGAVGGDPAGLSVARPCSSCTRSRSGSWPGCCSTAGSIAWATFGSAGPRSRCSAWSPRLPSSRVRSVLPSAMPRRRSMSPPPSRSSSPCCATSRSRGWP